MFKCSVQEKFSGTGFVMLDYCSRAEVVSSVGAFLIVNALVFLTANIWLLPDGWIFEKAHVKAFV